MGVYEDAKEEGEGVTGYADEELEWGHCVNRLVELVRKDRRFSNVSFISLLTGW